MGSGAAANVLGTIGTVLWCIQLVPQVIHNYRRKSCEGLPAVMLFLWALSGVPFGIYFIVQDANIPIQIQPQMFMLLSLITFGQCLYYPPINWKVLKTLIFSGTTLAIFAALEAGCIVPFKSLYQRGINWPVKMTGIIASVLIGAGLLPPYWELYKRKGQVVGINFIFLTIDSMGAVFSLLSLVFQDGDFDLLGCILYIIILVLEGGIFMSQLIWLVRTRKKNKNMLDKSTGDFLDISSTDVQSQCKVEPEDDEMVVEDDEHAVEDVEIVDEGDEPTVESNEHTVEDDKIAVKNNEHVVKDDENAVENNVSLISNDLTKT